MVIKFKWWARDPRQWIDNSVGAVSREAEDAALEHLTARAAYEGRLTPSLLYRKVLYYDILYMRFIRNEVVIQNRNVWVGGKCEVEPDLVPEILEDIDRMMLAGDVCEVEMDWSYSPSEEARRSA